jgi:RHS repeat-associated protein
MKNLTLKLYKFICVFLFIYSLILSKIIAQPCGSTLPPATGANPIFSFSQSACSGSNNPLGISFSGSAPYNGVHSWTFSGNGITLTANTPAGCIVVPTTGNYSISHQITYNGVTNSVGGCNLAVIDVIPQITYTTTLPSAAIKKTIDTKLPVGTIKGANTVSLTGAASYSIPIALPSGTRGVEPNLSLEYSSQSGVGLMGFGWNMAIGSAITRVSKDYYHDDAPSPPYLSDSDGLSLDGNRLVLMSGNYGTNNSTYGTKNETFSRITLKNLGNTTYFVVETKSGMKMEYGATNDARISSGNGKAVVWQLNKTEDPFGNYMKYKYMKYNNISLLSQVLYSGNGKLGIIPYHSINFEYKSRTDANTGYIAGVDIAANHLLKTITILAEGSLYRKYELDYSFDNIHSYLREIKVMEGDGKYLNDTQFQYGVDVGKDEVSTNLYSLSTNEKRYTGDFNGDGLSDVLDVDKANKRFRSLTKNANSNSFTPNTYKNDIDESVFKHQSGTTDQINFLAQDFNGDGYDDVPVTKTEFVPYEDKPYKIPAYTILKSINIYHPLGDGNFGPNVPFPINSTYNRIRSKKSIITGDFDGDSQADYMTILSNSIDFQAALHFPAINSLNNVVATTSNYFASKVINSILSQTIDFDGDGKSDLLLIDEKGKITVYSVFKDYNGVYESSVITDINIQGLQSVHFGDFNGDGKTDLLAEVADKSGSSYNSYHSDGSKFVGVSSFPDPDYADPYISDFNGDGLSDVLFSTNAEYKTIVKESGSNSVYSIVYTSDYLIFYSRGNSFYSKHYPYGTAPTSYTSVTNYSHEYSLGDFNGDGKSDLVINALMIRFSPNSTNHLLEKVVDGYNRTIDFKYENATANTIYTRGNLVTYPLNSIQVPMYMVSQMSAPDGVGGITSTKYKYDDMKIHRKGLGFLGCGSVTISNQSQGTESFSRFKILQNKQGNKTGYTTVPEYSYEKKSGILISETNQNFILEPLSNNRWWLKNEWTKTVNKVTGAETNSTPSYDNYGNVVTEVTKILNVQTSTVSHTFAQHGSWIPSSPISTTVSIDRTGSPTYSKTTNREFDAAGNVVSNIDFVGSPNEVVKRTEYYPNGLAHFSYVSATNSLFPVLDKKAEYRYDANFRFIEETYNSLNQLTSKVDYNKKWGKPTSVTDIDGNTTGYQYDGLGRLTVTTPPQGYQITTDYDWELSGGNALFNIFTHHPGKPDSKTYFDILEREYNAETETFGTNWLSVSKKYDNQGRVSSSISPTGVTTNNIYDDLNRVIESITPIGTTAFEYISGGGNTQVIVTPPNGHVSKSTTDATGKVIKKEDDGGVLEYAYDGQGNNILVKLAGKVVAKSIYDDAGNRTSFSEPNAGTNSYEYDAYGQLRKQTDSKGNKTTYEYDILGRNTTREGREGLTEYIYKTTQGGLNKIEEVYGFGGINQSYGYDGFGRITSLTDNGFTHSYEYDIYDNAEKETYPTGFKLERKYDVNSFLLTVQDAQTGKTFFSGKSMDNLENYSSYILGNNVLSDMTYDDYGLPVLFVSGGVQRLQFDFNQQTGNLTTRYDLKKGLSETFTYDKMDRLTGSSLNGLSISYAKNGNITTKSDAGGNYEYDGKKVNAVTKINSAKDINDIVQRVQYTSFQQPDEIWQQFNEGAEGKYFTYGPDYQRRVMETGECYRTDTTQHGSPSNCEMYRRRFYSGNYEEDHIAPSSTSPTGAVRKIHYISGGNGICAMYIQTQIGDDKVEESTFYVYKDYLGSFLTFTDEKGDVKYEQNFDAWGRKRNIDNWTYVDVEAAPEWAYRGYTGHEHLYLLFDGNDALINMNGRLYDPINGRMLSVDNYAHDDAGTQGYNRYSYAHNNPLKYTDPDGENPLIGAAIGGGIYTIMHLIRNKGSFNNWDWGGFAGAVIGGAVGGAIAPALSAAHIGGFAAGAITGAGSGFASGVSSGVFNGIKNDNFNLGNILLGAVKSAVIGAAIGGTIGGLDALHKGQNFWNGRSNISHEMYQDGTGTLTHKDGNYSNAEDAARMNDVNTLDATNSLKQKNGKYDSIQQNYDVDLNRGFEGEMTVKGYVNLRLGESSYYFNLDGKTVFSTTKSGAFKFPISSGDHRISWGIIGKAIKQDSSIELNAVSDTFTTIFGQWHSWTGFLWFR